MRYRIRKLRTSLGARFTLGIGLVILLTSALVFACIYRLQEDQAVAQLDIQARSLLTQMVVLRQWVADYGGVWTLHPGDYWWVERNGFYQKTPAMVTKELSKRSDNLGYYRFHITSLKLKNPENAPDDFERQALQAFESNPVPVAMVETTASGLRIYRYMIPLQTTEACLQCHGDQGYKVGDIRGGLSVLVPMAAVEDGLARNRQMLALASGALVAIVMFILYVLISKVIVRPVRQLHAVAVAISRGNFDITCDIRTGDELQTLGEAVNDMVQRLKQSHQDLCRQIEQRKRELATIANIALIISQDTDLEDMLRDILEETIAVTGVDGGSLHLLDEQSGSPILTTTSHLSSKLVAALHCEELPVAEQPYFVADAGANSSTQVHPFLSAGYRAWAGVPLRSKNRVLGILHLFSQMPHTFTLEDMALLQCIGNQIAVAIENVRNAQRVEQMAILEERNRLACEIHDGLAQALGYLNVKTDMIEGMLRRGEWADAQAELADVRRVIRDACYDVRESIDGLRTRLSDRSGLIPAAAAYLHEFGQRSGLLTEYAVSDGDMRLAPVVEAEAFRIIQEALTNIRKHAKARRVRLAIRTVEDMAHIEIEDDGRGFDPNSLPASRHFGLRIMRERAEHLGGTFHIESSPGKGTRLTVKVPMKARLIR